MANKEEMTTSISQKIKKFIDDTATLDVLTLSGKITLVAPKAQAGGQGANAAKDLDMDKLFKDVLGKLQTKSTTEVSVVAYTHAEWDQDSVNYVAEGANPDLVQNHRETVSAAHDSRVKALASAADTIKNLF